VSAGRAEPADESHADNLKTHLLFARNADAGQRYKKEIVMSGNLSHPAPTRRLPQQPNLEQLKKQAKELLERYRAGDAAAIAEINLYERRPMLPHLLCMMRSACWHERMAMKAGLS
jgi:hypothetical protein